jgi:gamma-aminobutyric acid receptor subunit delta
MRCVEAAVGLALLTSVSCSEKEGSTLEEIQLMLNQPPIPGLSCPKGPRELQALWSTSVYDKGNRPRTPIWYAGQLPAGSWPPTNVAVTIIPFRLGEFNTRTQLMTIDVEMSMLWWDPRLMFNASCATELAPPHVFGTHLQGSWMPGIFDDPSAAGLWMPRFAIDNLFPSGSNQGFYTRDRMLRIASAGLVWYTVRASVDVKCSMDFSKMPWDVQSCPVRVMAREGVDRVTLSKANDPRIETQIYQTQATRDEMSSVEWGCQNITQEAGSYHGSFGRTYFEDRTFMELKIVLQRKDRYWRTHVIIPTILLLAISWASFFISRAAVPARVAMCALPPTPVAPVVLRAHPDP